MRFILRSLLSVAVCAVFGLTACQQNAPNSSSSSSNNAAGNKAAIAPANTAEQAKNAAPPSQSPKVDEHGHSDDAPRITLAEAKKEFDAGNVVFVDTRAAPTYESEHIKGAINVPMEAVEARYKEIPKGKKIIAYCS